MSVVLCLPAHLCVSTAASRGQAPHGNASVRREAAERSRRRRDEEAYMEGVRREHLGSAYMEEPRRSHTDIGEEMEVAAVGVRGRG